MVKLNKKKSSLNEKKFRREKKDCNEKRSLGASILKGLGVAFGITCIVFVICALILTYTDMNDSFIGIVSTVCTAVSALCAGKIWASAIGKKGLAVGALSGIVYGVILLVISVISGGGPLSLGAGACLLIAAAGGGIGGILGVNTK